MLNFMGFRSLESRGDLMKLLSALALVTVFVFQVGPISQGAIVLQYQTLDSTNNPTLSPDVQGAGVTGAPMTAGTGIDVASGATWNWNNWDPANTSYAAAVAANETWTWGFNVTGNVSIELTTFDIRLDRSGTGPDDFEIQGAVNGGAPVSLLTFDYGDTSVGVDFLGVSLAPLGTVVQGDSVAFTLAAFNSEGTAGTFDLETIDFGGADPRALRIEGNITAVPEPASAMLLGVFSTGLLSFRRRRVI